MITRRFVGRQSAVISKERIQRPVLSNVAYTIQSKSVAEARKITIFAAIFHKSPYGYHLVSLDSSYTPIQAWSNIKHINPIRGIILRDIGEFKKILEQPCFKPLQEIHLNDAVPLVPLPENVKVFAYSNLSILVVLDGLKDSHNTKGDKNVVDCKIDTSIQLSTSKYTDSPGSNRTKKGHNKPKANNSNPNNNITTNKDNDTRNHCVISSPSHPQKENGNRKGKRGKSNNINANVNNCKYDTSLTATDNHNKNYDVNTSITGKDANNATNKSNIGDNMISNPNSKTPTKKRNKKLERAINRCVSYDTLLQFHPEMTINEYHKFCKASY